MAKCPLLALARTIDTGLSLTAPKAHITKYTYWIKGKPLNVPCKIY